MSQQNPTFTNVEATLPGSPDVPDSETPTKPVAGSMRYIPSPSVQNLKNMDGTGKSPVRVVDDALKQKALNYYKSKRNIRDTLPVTAQDMELLNQRIEELGTRHKLLVNRIKEEKEAQESREYSSKDYVTALLVYSVIMIILIWLLTSVYYGFSMGKPVSYNLDSNIDINGKVIADKLRVKNGDASILLQSTDASAAIEVRAPVEEESQIIFATDQAVDTQKIVLASSGPMDFEMRHPYKQDLYTYSGRRLMSGIDYDDTALPVVLPADKKASPIFRPNQNALLFGESLISPEESGLSMDDDVIEPPPMAAGTRKLASGIAEPMHTFFSLKSDSYNSSDVHLNPYNGGSVVIEDGMMLREQTIDGGNNDLYMEGEADLIVQNFEDFVVITSAVFSNTTAIEELSIGHVSDTTHARYGYDTLYAEPGFVQFGDPSSGIVFASYGTHTITGDTTMDGLLTVAGDEGIAIEGGDNGALVVATDSKLVLQSASGVVEIAPADGPVIQAHSLGLELEGSVTATSMTTEALSALGDVTLGAVTLNGAMTTVTGDITAMADMTVAMSSGYSFLVTFDDVDKLEVTDSLVSITDATDIGSTLSVAGDTTLVGGLLSVHSSDAGNPTVTSVGATTLDLASDVGVNVLIDDVTHVAVSDGQVDLTAALSVTQNITTDKAINAQSGSVTADLIVGQDLYVGGSLLRLDDDIVVHGYGTSLGFAMSDQDVLTMYDDHVDVHVNTDMYSDLTVYAHTFVNNTMEISGAVVVGGGDSELSVDVLSSYSGDMVVSLDTVSSVAVNVGTKQVSYLDYDGQIINGQLTVKQVCVMEDSLSVFAGATLGSLEVGPGGDQGSMIIADSETSFVEINANVAVAIGSYLAFGTSSVYSSKLTSTNDLTSFSLTTPYEMDIDGSTVLTSTDSETVFPSTSVSITNGDFTVSGDVTVGGSVSSVGQLDVVAGISATVLESPVDVGTYANLTLDTLGLGLRASNPDHSVYIVVGDTLVSATDTTTQTLLVDLAVSESLSVDGATAVGTTLSVGGDVTMDADVTVAGEATIQSISSSTITSPEGLSVTVTDGDLSLAVAGDSVFFMNVTAGNDLVVGVPAVLTSASILGDVADLRSAEGDFLVESAQDMTLSSTDAAATISTSIDGAVLSTWSASTLTTFVASEVQADFTVVDSAVSITNGADSLTCTAGGVYSDATLLEIGNSESVSIFTQGGATFSLTADAANFVADVTIANTLSVDGDLSLSGRVEVMSEHSEISYSAGSVALDVDAGDDTVFTTSAGDFQVGDMLRLTDGANVEIRVVSAVDAGLSRLTVFEPFQLPYTADSAEMVRILPSVSFGERERPLLVLTNDTSALVSDLYVAGDVTLHNNVYVDNDVAVSGALSVDGTTTLGSDSADTVTILASSAFAADAIFNGGIAQADPTDANVLLGATSFHGGVTVGTDGTTGAEAVAFAVLSEDDSQNTVQELFVVDAPSGNTTVYGHLYAGSIETSNFIVDDVLSLTHNVSINGVAFRDGAIVNPLIDTIDDYSGGGVTISGVVSNQGTVTAYGGASPSSSHADAAVVTIDSTYRETDMQHTARAGVLFRQYFYDSTGDTASEAPVDAAMIAAGAQSVWTEVAATRDAFLAMSTTEDGTLSEKMRLTAEGALLLGPIVDGSGETFSVQGASGDVAVGPAAELSITGSTGDLSSIGTGAFGSGFLVGGSADSSPGTDREMAVEASGSGRAGVRLQSATGEFSLAANGASLEMEFGSGGSGADSSVFTVSGTDFSLFGGNQGDVSAGISTATSTGDATFAIASGSNAGSEASLALENGGGSYAVKASRSSTNGGSTDALVFTDTDSGVEMFSMTSTEVAASVGLTVESASPLLTFRDDDTSVEYELGQDDTEFVFSSNGVELMRSNSTYATWTSDVAVRGQTFTVGNSEALTTATAYSWDVDTSGSLLVTAVETTGGVDTTWDVMHADDTTLTFYGNGMFIEDGSADASWEFKTTDAAADAMLVVNGDGNANSALRFESGSEQYTFTASLSSNSLLLQRSSKSLMTFTSSLATSHTDVLVSVSSGPATFEVETTSTDQSATLRLSNDATSFDMLVDTDDALKMEGPVGTLLTFAASSSPTVTVFGGAVGNAAVNFQSTDGNVALEAYAGVGMDATFSLRNSAMRTTLELDGTNSATVLRDDSVTGDILTVPYGTSTATFFGGSVGTANLDVTTATGDASFRAGSGASGGDASLVLYNSDETYTLKTDGGVTGDPLVLSDTTRTLLTFKSSTATFFGSSVTGAVTTKVETSDSSSTLHVLTGATGSDASLTLENGERGVTLAIDGSDTDDAFTVSSTEGFTQMRMTTTSVDFFGGDVGDVSLGVSSTDGASSVSIAATGGSAATLDLGNEDETYRFTVDPNDSDKLKIGASSGGDQILEMSSSGGITVDKEVTLNAALTTDSTLTISGSLGVEACTADAATSITIGDNCPFLLVNFGVASNSNTITMPTGYTGKMLVIHNADDDPLNPADLNQVPSGAVALYIYVSNGWVELLNVST
eukprot:Rmarinus@m.12543